MVVILGRKCLIGLSSGLSNLGLKSIAVTRADSVGLAIVDLAVVGTVGLGPRLAVQRAVGAGRNVAN